MEHQQVPEPLKKSDLAKLVIKMRRIGTTVFWQVGQPGPTLFERASVELAYSIHESSEKLARLTNWIIAISSIMALLVFVQIAVQVLSIYSMGFLSN